MAAESLALPIALTLAVCVSAVIWRLLRKTAPVSYLKNATVSRQWLVEHRGED